MKHRMPPALLFAEFAIGVLVVYLGVGFALDIASQRVFPQTLIHLCWTLFALVGIWHKWPLAWRVGYIISAVGAIAGVVLGGFFLGDVHQNGDQGVREIGDHLVAKKRPGGGGG